MNLQECYNLINQFIEKHSELETAKDLGQVLNLLYSNVKDNRWDNSVQNLLGSLCRKYPTLNYFIDSFNKKVKLPYTETAKLCNYLSIAGLCINTELFIESKNYSSR